MLLLGWKKGEKILIGKDILIVNFGNSNITLGIEAPEEIQVSRIKDPHPGFEKTEISSNKCILTPKNQTKDK